MSLQDVHKEAGKLTSSGAERRLFVSDFHGTLADTAGVRRDYFKALVMMHLAGHNVVIASGDPDNAQEELSNSPVAQVVIEELGLSPDDERSVREGLMKIQDKAGLLMHIKGLGLKPYPEVFCDDDMPGLPTKYHLHPYDDEYDGFSAVAAIDPDLALETLLTNPEALRIEQGADIQEWLNTREVA